MSDLSEDELQSLIGGDDGTTVDLGDSLDVDDLLKGNDEAGGTDLDSLDALVEPEKASSGSKSVSPAAFAKLSGSEHGSGDTTNMHLLMDVPMQVSVELGRASRTVKEILSLNVGSVVELDKLSGEPVDLLVNGRIIAKAEVVIIDENFGIRITEIAKSKDRLVLE